MFKFAAGYVCGVASVIILGAYLVAQEEAGKEGEREANKKRAAQNKA